jgi:hypothetical protein
MEKIETIDESNKDLIDAQIKPMLRTWDNKEDEVWDEFNNDIKQAFYELKNNQGKKTNKFVNIEI